MISHDYTLYNIKVGSGWVTLHSHVITLFESGWYAGMHLHLGLHHCIPVTDIYHTVTNIMIININTVTA